MKLFLVSVLAVAFSAQISAVDFNLGNGTETIYQEGDTLNFTAETVAENSSFSVEIAENGSELSNFDLDRVKNRTEDNQTYYVYSNFRPINFSTSGYVTAFLMENESSIGNISFRMADDRPRILSLDTSYSLIFAGEEVQVEATVSDSEENVNSSDLFVNSEEIDFSEKQSDRNIQRFTAGYTVSSQGSYSYNASFADTSGYEVSGESGFYAYGEPETESSYANVTVDRRCLNYTRTFEAPGQGPQNLIQRNGTGSFLAEFVNQGTIEHQMDLSLDVTNESNNSWDPGEEIGNTVLSYSNKTGIMNSSSRFEYYRRFEAVYPEGNYTGRLHVDSLCEDPDENRTLDFSFNMTDNFRIVGVQGSGEGAEEGNQVTNQTTEADVNETGSESDQSIEGDQDAPALTPRPEPEPEPEPEPDPTPRPLLSVNMETERPEYTTPRNRFQEISINVTNFANSSIQNLELIPQTDELEGSWQSRSASLENINVSERLVRSVYVNPGQDVSPGRYRVPVLAQLDNGRPLDVEYTTVRVQRTVFQENLTVVEAPRRVSIQRNSTETIPILIRNDGREQIENVSLEVQNVESCGSVSSDSVGALAPNESDTLQARIDSSDSITDCQALFVVSSAGGAYSFANVRFEITPAEGLVPPEFRVPLVAVAWTTLLVLYAFLTRFYSLENTYVKIPFVLLIMGEALIVLYLATTYYGILPSGILPF